MLHKQTFVERFYKDKSDKVVLAQTPNLPIIGWILFKLLNYLPVSNQAHTALSFISTSFLFTWAYLEVVSGVTYARRILGIVVLFVIITPYL